jgi:uncharacterized SAM-binding protein YcdF (DUF218 family)
MSVPFLRTTLRLATRTLAVCTILAAGWCRTYGGRYLQHEDALDHADGIFVLAGSHVERPLEAVDLYRGGYAPMIVLSPGATEPAEMQLRGQGIRVPRDSDSVRDVMVRLGIPAAAVIVPDASVDNTAQEAGLLRAMAAQRGWQRVIVVTSKYHTRRTGFAFRRELEGTGISITVRASRYDPADPANWWRHRGDLRVAAPEWQKLIAYYLGLGG